MYRSLVFLILFLPCLAQADIFPAAPQAMNSISHPSWISQSSLKWGFAGTFCATQAVSGLVEGYHFRNGCPTYYINDKNYHAYETIRDIGYIGSGYLAYANAKNPYQSKWGKARRFAGALLIGRDCKEWAYRAARYNNPFDYTPERNQHSIVYFGIRNGKLTDLYIGTGKASGPLVDMACLALGMFLLGWE